jgi:8-oxo-dGTP diphosphatase
MNPVEKPTLVVNIIIEKDDKLLLVKRKKDPFKGYLSFPGGTVSLGENVEDAIRSETLEETNLKIAPTDILGVYSNPMRDPSGHKISITFVGKVVSGDAHAGGDAESLEWVPVDEQTAFAFDHQKILQDYLDWKDYKGSYWSSKQRELAT